MSGKSWASNDSERDSEDPSIRDKSSQLAFLPFYLAAQHDDSQRCIVFSLFFFVLFVTDDKTLVSGSISSKQLATLLACRRASLPAQI